MIKLIKIISLAFIVSFNLSGQVSSKIEQTPCDSALKSEIEIKAMYALAGRMVEYFPMPDSIDCAPGKYSFTIYVSNEGQVVDSEFQTQQSDTISKQQIESFKDTINNMKFSKNVDAPKKQKGNVTYYFKTKED